MSDKMERERKISTKTKSAALIQNLSVACRILS